MLPRSPDFRCFAGDASAFHFHPIFQMTEATGFVIAILAKDMGNHECKSGTDIGLEHSMNNVVSKAHTASNCEFSENVRLLAT